MTCKIPFYSTKSFYPLLICLLFSILCQLPDAFTQVAHEEQIIFFQTNLLVEPADVILERIDRAKLKGANTVSFGDSKLNIFGHGGNPGARWKNELDNLVEGVRSRGMRLIFNTIVTGFNGAVLNANPSLTTGYPIINQEVEVVNQTLIPKTSATISNGGFEIYSENSPDDWTFQDNPGVNTFIDTNVKRSGNASFRIDPRNGEQARVFRTFAVKPFHQYTLVCWIKTENLSAQRVQALLRDENNKDRTLTNLAMSTPKEGGGRAYFTSTSGLDLDWTEVRIAFNSLESTIVNLGLTVYGGEEGSIWWDDIEIIDSPFLNWINRDDLPKSIVKDGIPLQLGVDVEMPNDELLGQSTFVGSYDTQHLSPVVAVINDQLLPDNEVLFVSGYHALPTSRNAQVSGAWNNPDWLNTVKTIHQTLYNEYQPDGLLLNYSEIRTGGWEPTDLQFGSSGAALSNSILHSITDLQTVAPGVDVYFWNDMVDPHHNAVENYYQVNNTLDQSWLSLDPDKVKIITWWEGQKIVDKGPLSLSHFSDLGFKQIVGGYYNADVQENYNQWTTASNGINNIIGSMFTTWNRDYTQIEAFGDLWWLDDCENRQYFGDNALTGTITEARIYQSNSDIESTQLIESPFTVNYNSANSVHLNGGFTTEFGSTFHAFIQGCLSED